MLGTLFLIYLISSFLGIRGDTSVRETTLSTVDANGTFAENGTIDTTPPTEDFVNMSQLSRTYN